MASAARRVLVVGDGCVGTYAATTIAARHPRASVVLKSRCGTTSDKTVVDSLCSSAGVRRLESFAALRGGAQRAFDAVIVATKTYDHAKAAAELRRAGVTASRTLVVHNGMRDASVQFPGDASTVVTPGGYMLPKASDGDPNILARVRQRDIAVKNPDAAWAVQPIEITAGGGGESDVAAELLRESGFAVSGQFGYAALRKFLVNNTANLLSIVHDCNVDGLLKVPQRREQMSELYDEAMCVLQAASAHDDPAVSAAVASLSGAHFDSLRVLPSGYGGDGSSASKFKAEVFDMIASYRKHYPSSHQDYTKGGRVEVDAFNGFVAKLAQRASVAAPHNLKLAMDVDGKVAAKRAALYGAA